MNIPENWTDTFFDAKRNIGDPPADTVLHQLVTEKGPEEARKLFDLLIRNIDMPMDQFSDSVKTFLKDSSQLPAWADIEKIKLGQALFRDHGPKFLIFLYYKSLPLLYTCAKGAEVLVHTRRLMHNEEVSKIFKRRLAEKG